ncbi:MAPK regulated corepressor interacting protein 2 [Myotis lucifugus]|uniref:MAPK regulated corepressor interacting protein 2 n=1 Tax=Myotis lucifugus TaxID=59463 RepID=UPI000CCC0EFA|nr:MAPK regulated corepressor interacting protein 2 [Myotis lucifugus]
MPTFVPKPGQPERVPGDEELSESLVSEQRAGGHQEGQDTSWCRNALAVMLLGHAHWADSSTRGPSPHSASPPLPGPRLVFNRVNGRRPPTTSPSAGATQETYTLAHEENVRFVSEAWQQVEQQLGGGPAGESSPRPVQYVERTPNPRLQNFVPIDLDEWWAQQFLARITNCS